MRWLVMYPKLGPAELKSLRDRYVAVANHKGWLMHWIDGPPEPGPLAARIRYRQADQPCSMEHLGEGRARVHFAQAQRAVAPGQYVVFYQGECCLGGGVIETRIA